MKKVFVAAALLIGVFASAAPTPAGISDRILKAFKETFKYAKDITWHEYQDYYQASFKQDEIQVRAQYADDGTLLKTIRYYKEDNLLPCIVAKLKRKYAGKEIFGVTETSSNDDMNFVINLKDEDNWYVVTSDVFGNLQQTDKFRRAEK